MAYGERMKEIILIDIETGIGLQRYRGNDKPDYSFWRKLGFGAKGFKKVEE